MSDKGNIFIGTIDNSGEDAFIGFRNGDSDVGSYGGKTVNNSKTDGIGGDLVQFKYDASTDIFFKQKN